MIFVLDNYDSFTYNLVQLLAQYDDVRVERNDKISVEEIERSNPSHIVISPGPGRPEQAGITVDLITGLGPKIPTLGVCLGHQAIGYAFGCTIVRAVSLMHGKTSEICHGDNGIYHGLRNPFVATRYHSLVIDRDSLVPELDITSETDDGIIMGVKHKTYPIEGIQFHPESILTTEGPKLIKNWLTVNRKELI
jgi:anthranilate synthase/aminodeoxychorismate synthase-like glutamine amidotransferase